MMGAFTHMDVTLHAGKRISARFGDFEIHTDQTTASGGEGSAPSPFDLFLASLGTCAAYYVLDFCATRGIPTEGITLRQHWQRDPQTKRIQTIEQVIELPREFPRRYEKAVVRAASQCTVKKHLENPPQFEIRVGTQRVESGDTIRQL